MIISSIMPDSINDQYLIEKEIKAEIILSLRDVVISA
jgi:hypothetical protein